MRVAPAWHERVRPQILMGTVICRWCNSSMRGNISMKIHWLSGFLLIVLPFVSAQPEPLAANPPPAVLLGYSSQNAALQNQWEGKFRDGISPANIRESMRRLSARPHHVGSPYDKDNAEWILSKFREWGFDA